MGGEGEAAWRAILDDPMARGLRTPAFDTDMIYAATPTEVAERRKAFLRTWRLKCQAVADSLEEAGDRLFTFTRLPPSQWKSARTTNAVERSGRK